MTHLLKNERPQLPKKWQCPEADGARIRAALFVLSFPAFHPVAAIFILF
jgi:hypothetical protein